MRNSLVILFSFCIGLGSGFIVPTGVLEVYNQRIDLFKDQDIVKPADVKQSYKREFAILSTTTENPKEVADLEKKQNVMNDRALYEDANAKQNNVNERSFIFINQRFKTQVLHQLFSSHFRGHKPISPDASQQKPYVSSVINLKEIPQRFSVSTLKADSEDLMVKGIKHPYFVTPRYITKSYNNDQKNVYNKHCMSDANNKLEDQRNMEYIELLKSPLLRPVAVNVKFNRNINSANSLEVENMFIKNVDLPDKKITNDYVMKSKEQSVKTRHANSATDKSWPNTVRDTSRYGSRSYNSQRADFNSLNFDAVSDNIEYFNKGIANEKLFPHVESYVTNDFATNVISNESNNSQYCKDVYDTSACKIIGCKCKENIDVTPTNEEIILNNFSTQINDYEEILTGTKNINRNNDNM